MLVKENTNVATRLEAYAAQKGWTYKGPEPVKIGASCTMQCAVGHVWEAPVAGFLFPPQAGCPECMLEAQKTKKKPPKIPHDAGPAKPNQKPRFRLTPEELGKRLTPRGIALVGEWKGTGEIHVFSCLTCEGTWQEKGSVQVNPLIMTSKQAGCPYCTRRSKKSTFKLLTPPRKPTAK